MNVFNEDTRVKIPATVQVLRLGYDYQSMKEAEIDFDTKVFISRFKSSLERINNRDFSDEEISDILTDIHNIHIFIRNSSGATRTAACRN